MFDDRVYKRGALTLHALRTRIGDDTFFDATRDWTRLHRHGSTSTDEFVAHIRAHGGDVAAELLENWLFEHQLPALPEG